MIREEAIDLLDNLLGMVEDSQGHDYDHALHMAIEALEEYESLAKSLNDAVELIHKLQKKNDWIPARERLPKNDDLVIVTILDEKGDTPFRRSDFGWYLEKANCWWIVAAEQRNNVVAWMPLPEPYAERREE